ncbi:ribbon-helix-helix domain-containing protein [Prosthecomicrobium hirschii]|uniref:ribbon-helix-helix domain-containing protein n=1 Tax=Prosthecodimorpha hirschii TaxID=665126 RepID=UPI00221E9826|nr:ribbon-helix-helix domain-containing protein [Prosthecomicrobium hirschii]MCW1844139.1 ribbon-helix-helix domain-containing protein [Prosthecomicrobium hirschii]
MTETISNTRKGRGRPRVDATQLSVRLPPDQLAALDQWIAATGRNMTRPEALREILRAAIAVKA